MEITALLIVKLQLSPELLYSKKLNPSNFFDGAGGVACHEGVGGHIVHYHATGGYHGTIADAYARHHGHASAKPHIIAYGDG